MELSSARLLRGRSLAWRLVPALIAKDLFTFACWFIAPVRRTAEWRGRPYRLLPRGRIAPLTGDAGGLPIPLEAA
jgi:hypothetical protein